jgi:hypothetical protein
MPPDLRPYASVGYTYVDGAFQIFPAYVAQPALFPSGMLQASVMDMARFMIAHLQGGFYGDASTEMRILEETTAQQMHTTQYTPDPRFLGIAYGFFDFSQNGQRTIGHRGVARPMNSLLLLLPDQNLGVFVTYNSAGGGYLADPHSGFQNAFFDHYYPASAVAPVQPAAGFTERAGRFVGSYRLTSFPYTSFQKVGSLFGGMTAEISESGDGTLLLTYPDYGLELRFVEVEPLYFRQVDGPYNLAFHEDERGRFTRMFLDPINFTAFDKLDWYETPGFNIPLLLVCILAFVSMILVGLIRFIRDLRRSGDRKTTSRGARAANWIILGIGLSMPNELLDPPLILKIVLGLGVLAAVLTAGALVYSVLAWKDSYWSSTFRAYYTLVTVAAVAFVWFLNYWNLLGWRY